MQARVHFSGIAAVVGTALLLFSGPATAQLEKQETKCANSINKGAAKVAKAQAGDNSACIKDYGKNKIPSAEACITSDPKGKVAKAISKIKTSDCTGGAPSFLPGLKTSSSAIGDIMKAKDLELIHDLFGTDLDVSIVDAGVDKAGAKCQAAVAKAAGKCQAAKLGSFNSCKKDKLKAGDTDIEACLGTGTGGIPDPKGKIQKKCGGDFDLAKKCTGTTTPLDALIPGCAPGVTGACIDQKIECRVCLALNALDGLDRDCDEFDDGVVNGSCLAVSVCPADIFSEVSTGMDGQGFSDPLWGLTSVPPSIPPGPQPLLGSPLAVVFTGGWVSPLTGSNWISATISGGGDCSTATTPGLGCPGGDYVYITCWRQCGKVTLDLCLLADNCASVDYVQNGVTINLGLTAPCGGLPPFQVPTCTGPTSIPAPLPGNDITELIVTVQNDGSTITGMDLSGSVTGALLSPPGFGLCP